MYVLYINQGEQKLLAHAPVKAKPPSTGVESLSISPRKIQLRHVKET
jgi:hypothetical protein